VWEEGRNLLKIIKKNFDWNRTSWWPPDKDKAKREFAKYVKKLQQAAQREVSKVREEGEKSSVKASLIGLSLPSKNIWWFIIGGIVIIALIFLIKR
jgi:hypothetical protein